MKKEEIIKHTLMEMKGADGLLHNNFGDDCDDYVDLVIATLSKRLPEGELKICKDFRILGVSCCECCHKGYAHYEMSLEELKDGSRAWMCCTVRYVLRKRGAVSQAAGAVAKDAKATEVEPNHREDGRE